MSLPYEVVLYPQADIISTFSPSRVRSEKKHCLLCGGEARSLFDKDGYDICRCAHCDHVFADYLPPRDHVGRVYGEKYFFGGGAGYPNYFREEKILRAHGRRYGKLLARYMMPGEVLDVGAAAGFVLQGLQEQGWQGKGLEPNPRMAKFAREQLGLAVASTTLEEYRTSECFDLINMVQVLAHFTDLAAALRNAVRLTKPGGYWLVETWNRASWMARLFGRNWHEFSPPSVLHWFSPASLRRLLAQYGMHEVAIGRPAKRIAVVHAKTLLQHKLGNGPIGRVLSGMLEILPEHAALPYPAFDLFWGIYRKVGDEPCEIAAAHASK